MSSKMEFRIRPAEPKDSKTICDLIQELGIYEKMPDGPTLTEDDIRRDGFGNVPLFKCIVADAKNEDDSFVTVGYALYYPRYSTWVGKYYFLEDFYVKPEYRGGGIGSALFDALVQIAVSENCKRLEFSVLNWNIPSIEFYKARGATNLTTTEGWNLFRIEQEALLQMNGTQDRLAL